QHQPPLGGGEDQVARHHHGVPGPSGHRREPERLREAVAVRRLPYQALGARRVIACVCRRCSLRNERTEGYHRQDDRFACHRSTILPGAGRKLWGKKVKRATEAGGMGPIPWQATPSRHHPIGTWLQRASREYHSLRPSDGVSAVTALFLPDFCNLSTKLQFRAETVIFRKNHEN